MMNFKFYLLVILLSPLNVLSQPSPTRNYDFSQVMTNDGTNYYKIFWKIIPPNINFGIVCNPPSGGWCGFGWSSAGLMVTPPSDAVIGSINGGVVTILDFILNQKVAPTVMGSCPNAVCPETLNVFNPPCFNNVFNTTGSTSGAYVVLEFTRPLNASDSCDTSIVDGHYAIWSMGTGAVPTSMAQHLFRDSTFLNGVGTFTWFRNLTQQTSQGTTITSMSSSVVPSATTSQVGTSMTPIIGGSSGFKVLGLAYYWAIVILIAIVCVVVVILTTIIAIIVKSRSNSRTGFY